MLVHVGCDRVRSAVSVSLDTVAPHTVGRSLHWDRLRTGSGLGVLKLLTILTSAVPQV